MDTERNPTDPDAPPTPHGEEPQPVVQERPAPVPTQAQDDETEESQNDPNAFAERKAREAAA